MISELVFTVFRSQPCIDVNSCMAVFGGRNDVVGSVINFAMTPAASEARRRML